MFRQVMISLSRLFCLSAVVLLGAIGTAYADDPKVLGRYQAWTAFTMNQGSDKVCFIVSDPKEKRLSRRGRNRGDVFFLVTHWPGESIYAQPSVVIGYPFGRNATPTVQVGSDKYNMVLDTETEENEERAWISDPAAERRLIDALKRGSEMTVTGRSASGTVSTDQYSLLGFTAALERIDQECR